ncbi:MAG: tetratricopeptide repeat protein [Candidatus Thiodiazotropha sp. (ex Monitilora ramsayi)]|nr:tetratricopeptide repeat protein [Candidatus Thiodiazotropha sp. (ex Monitilora ramsayi)]
MASHLSKLEPPGRNACLCGSGARFKNCCKNEYSKKHFDGWKLFNKGEYRKALKAIRLHITWYRLCHMAHTVPFLTSNSDESRKLLKTDIEAMSDMLDLLLSCYAKCDMVDDYPFALEYLSSAIDDDRWEVKIDYHKCIYLYVYRDKREAAKEILEAYDWKQVSDVDLLTVLIDVYSDDLNPVEKTNIAERICEISSSPEINLQYRSLIGTEYCLLNDSNKGIPILKSAIHEYEKTLQEYRTPLGRHHLAISYKHLGELSGKEEYFTSAIANLKNEIATGEYSSIGEGQLWLDLGWCYHHLSEFDKAIDAYDKSLNHVHSGLTLVFKSRAFIELDKLDEARDMLNSVILEDLTEPNIFDYSISKCYLAFASKESGDIQDGLDLIKGIKTNDPMFMDLIQDLISQLYELKSTKTEDCKVETALQRFNRYVSLKPNFFGFGIDINAIIDDMGNRPSNN